MECQHRDRAPFHSDLEVADEVIQMTPRQTEYVKHRAAGLGQAQAAKAAGYAPVSAKVIASRMEKLPAIRAAIDEARDAKPDTGPLEFEDAQSYLRAVVKGTTPADPVRVGAARALLPFERARQRAPVKGPTPQQLDRRDAQSAEQELLEAWAQKAATVRDRLKRQRGAL